MARIRVLTSVAGEGFSWRAGEEVDLPGAEAQKWADGVRAEWVRDEPVETPEAATVERSSGRKAPTRRRPSRKE